ncbi:MAG TPA: hypothetical protein PKM73_10900 [Verrucomicrobiota bacterium]|nr:hypothetical protein [Verrucomicrobiota bacterium]HNU52716.1 hypothetical protein [Verrucomicrobiota bacterium]
MMPPDELADMPPDGLEELAHGLMKQGLPEETAWDYAVLIGDTPEQDEDGKWVVRDDKGNVLARVDLLF